MRPLCPDCKTREIGKHANCKWCAVCAARRRKRPIAEFKVCEQQLIRRLAGKERKTAIAERIGCSPAQVSRWARSQKLSLSTKPYATRPDTVQRVIDFYLEHGRPATEEQFPEVKVRSIVERYPLNGCRQRRWSQKEMVEAVRMAGLVSFESQAKYFNRPNAKAGSIKSLWMKRFGVGVAQLHGMSLWNAKYILEEPYKKTKVGGNELPEGVALRRIVLWCDADGCLKEGLPKSLAHGIKAMADFQRWMFQSDNPRQKILRLIRTRR